MPLKKVSSPKPRKKKEEGGSVKVADKVQGPYKEVKKRDGNKLVKIY